MFHIATKRKRLVVSRGLSERSLLRIVDLTFYGDLGICRSLRSDDAGLAVQLTFDAVPEVRVLRGDVKFFAFTVDFLSSVL